MIIQLNECMYLFQVILMTFFSPSYRFDFIHSVAHGYKKIIIPFNISITGSDANRLPSVNLCSFCAFV